MTFKEKDSRLAANFDSPDEDNVPPTSIDYTTAGLRRSTRLKELKRAEEAHPQSTHAHATSTSSAVGATASRLIVKSVGLFFLALYSLVGNHGYATRLDVDPTVATPNQPTSRLAMFVESHHRLNGFFDDIINDFSAYAVQSSSN